ncbi:hypothetical protein ACQPZZ_04445 [Microbispora sp. CA-135349]|uniref:hypothetical protein n=1 Tax=Microbispora sp. CA-135349 TaxID=3239953 RepID=UPI003D8A49EF
MIRSRTDARAQRRKGTGIGFWIPVLVNLALGVPASAPLYLAWWLLTQYLPMDCRSAEDFGKTGLVNCNYTILDHSSVVMLLLVVTGVFTVALVVAIDVILPLRRGRRPMAWLAAAALIPVPFAVCMALA